MQRPPLLPERGLGPARSGRRSTIDDRRRDHSPCLSVAEVDGDGVAEHLSSCRAVLRGGPVGEVGAGDRQGTGRGDQAPRESAIMHADRQRCPSSRPDPSPGTTGGARPGSVRQARTPRSAHMPLEEARPPTPPRRRPSRRAPERACADPPFGGEQGRYSAQVEGVGAQAADGVRRKDDVPPWRTAATAALRPVARAVGSVQSKYCVTSLLRPPRRCRRVT